MKKQTKKLVLSKETLARLSDAQAGRAKGGYTYWATDSTCESDEFVDRDSVCPRAC